MCVCVCVVSLANNNASNWAKRAYYVYAMLCVNIYAYAGRNKGSWTVFMSYTREARVAQRAGSRMGEIRRKEKQTKNKFKLLSLYLFLFLLHSQLLAVFATYFHFCGKFCRQNLMAQQAATCNNKRSPWQAAATLATCLSQLHSCKQQWQPLLMPHMADLINYARGK